MNYYPATPIGGANRRHAERLMNKQQGQREQHLLKLLQEANRRIEELEAEKRSGK